MELTETITLIVALVVIALGVTYLILYHKFSNKKDVSTATVDITKLLEALGGKDNITNTFLDHKRLKIHLVNPKLVSQALLKTLDISGFLSGKELKLLIKEKPIEVKNNLDKLRNGVIR